MNVGPTHDGRIDPIQEERLRQMGDWLKVNGEAIYNSVPWKHQNDTLTPDVWYEFFFFYRVSLKPLLIGSQLNQNKLNIHSTQSYLNGQRIINSI